MQKHSNINAWLRSSQDTYRILNGNCSERIQLIYSNKKVGTKSLHLLQHLISDPIHDVHNPMKGLLKFLSCNDHLCLNTFQKIDPSILLFPKNNHNRFECMAHFWGIFRIFLPMFLSLSKRSLQSLYLWNQRWQRIILIDLFLQRINKLDLFP